MRELGAATTATTAPIRVLVVDDSTVIRGLIARSLEADPAIKVVATAANGKMAIDEVARNEIEVVVLDIEMPVMDGMTALPQLLQARPGLQVIMASTLTLKGASISMKALSRGAADYVPKPSSTGEINSAADFKRELISKVKSWGAVARRRRGSAARQPGEAPSAPVARRFPAGPITLRAVPNLFRHVDKVLLAKAALRFRAGRQGLGQRHGDPGFGAFQDLRTAEVSAIGNGRQLLRLQNRLRLLGHVRQLRAVRAAVRHLVCDDQVMLRLYRDLHIIVNDAGAAATGCHGIDCLDL